MASCANRISALTEGEALSLMLAASSGCDCLEVQTNVRAQEPEGQTRKEDALMP